jgi:hypothetical protein
MPIEALPIIAALLIGGGTVGTLAIWRARLRKHLRANAKESADRVKRRASSYQMGVRPRATVAAE